MDTIQTCARTAFVLTMKLVLRRMYERKTVNEEESLRCAHAVRTRYIGCRPRSWYELNYKFCAVCTVVEAVLNMCFRFRQNQMEKRPPNDIAQCHCVIKRYVLTTTTSISVWSDGFYDRGKKGFAIALIRIEIFCRWGFHTGRFLLSANHHPKRMWTNGHTGQPKLLFD
jgi:hypothetical protein